MALKPKSLVLDTWAIIAFYEEEPAAQQVADIIAQANEEGTPLWMSVVNAGELWYLTARETSPAEADATIEELRSFGIKLENVDWEIARQAGVFKSKYKMSYADAMAAALTLQKNGHLVTGDRDFKHLENEVKLIWLKGG
jgi:predicted nucleic acid-binding protein